MANEKQNTEKARELTLHETAEAIANDLWERYSDNDMGPQDLSDFKADTAITERWLESHAAHVTSDLTAENERLTALWREEMGEKSHFIFKLADANTEIVGLEQRIVELEGRIEAIIAPAEVGGGIVAALTAENERLTKEVCDISSLAVQRGAKLIAAEAELTALRASLSEIGVDEHISRSGGTESRCLVNHKAYLAEEKLVVLKASFPAKAQLAAEEITDDAQEEVTAIILRVFGGGQ